MNQSNFKPILFFFLFFVGCSDDALPGKLVDPHPQIDMAQQDAHQSDLSNDFSRNFQELRKYCGGKKTTGSYVDAILDYKCTNGVFRTTLNLYECTGCSTPFVCNHCESVPSTYLIISLDSYDVDLTNTEVISPKGFVFECEVGGRCIEPKSWKITFEKHLSNECLSGSYEYKLESGRIEKGVFDASTITPYAQSDIEDCSN